MTTKTAEAMTTKTQRDLIRHSLFGSHDRKKKPFRNYFCTSVGGEHEPGLLRLVKLGLMIRGPYINDGQDYYVFVTPAGAAEIDTTLPKAT